MQAAIDSMTRSLALEWGYYGIRVSGIAPGWIGDTTGLLLLHHSLIYLTFGLQKKRKGGVGKTRPVGVNVMRSQVLYRAAHTPGASLGSRCL